MTKSRRSLRLASEYRDCIAALNSRQVTYVLVGAYAVGWHGAARATGDIDFLYEQSHKNVAQLCAALRDFGAPSSLIDPEFMMSREPITQIGIVPLRIDFIAAISGVTFDEVNADAIDDNVDGISLRVISLRNLLRNKRATGRPKDKLDIRRLERLADTQ